MATNDDDSVIAALRRPIGYNAPVDNVDPLNFRNAAPIAQSSRDAAVADKTGQSAKALDVGIRNFTSIPEALYGAGANLVSPGAGDSALEDVAAAQQHNKLFGPAIQSTADVHGVKDALSLVRNQALMAAPDIALALAGGGAGGAAVKTLAKRAGLRAAEELAARQAAKSGASEVTQGAVSRAASRLVPTALDAAEPAVAAGRAAGTVAGQYPSVVASSVEGAPDASGKLVGGLKGASQEDTAKILLGDLGAAGIGALPEIRLLGRLGGTAAQEAIQKNAQAILPRIAKEAGVQGGLGAATGLAQTAAQYAAHKWVNDHVDLMSPTAFQSYLDSAVAGGALGAGLGGATEGGAAIGARLGSIGEGGRTAALDGLRSTIKGNLSRFAQAKDAAYSKAKGTYDAFFNKQEGAPEEGTPVDGSAAPEGTQTPTERAVDIGARVGEGAASIHKAATDLFDRINQHLSTDEGRAATESAVKDTFSKVAEPLQAGLKATLDSFKAAMSKAKTPEGQQDVQKAYGKILSEHVDAETPDATSSFQDHVNRLDDEDQLESDADGAVGRMSQRFETGETDSPINSTRAPTANPVRLGSKLQDQLATVVPVDSPLWHFPDTLGKLTSSAEKMFTGDELDAQDHRNIDTLRRFDPDQVRDWEATAPEVAKMHLFNKAHADAYDEANARPDSTALGDELQRALKERSDAATAKKGIEEPATEDTGATPAHDAINERTFGDLNDKSLTDRLAQADVGSDEHTALQGELHQRLLKDGGVFTENRSSQKARDLWATKDPTKNANTIGIEPTKLSGGAVRQRALQLDNLISKKLAEPDNKGKGPNVALGQVLGDLHLAGVKINPDTITPGKFYTTAKGDAYYLSPKEAAAIRAGMRDTKPNRALPDTSGKRAARAAEQSGEVYKAAMAEGKTVADKAKEKIVPTNEKVAEHQGADDSRVEGPERVTRKPPPATQEAITAVKLKPTEYQKVLDRVRQAYPQTGVDAEGKPHPIRFGESTAEQARIAHEGGVEIGKSELKKQLDSGAISERTYGVELRRLNDPASGESTRYLRNVQKGKYDTASVTETPRDDATPTPKHEETQELRDNLEARYRKLNESEGKARAISDKELTLTAKSLDAKWREGGEARKSMTDIERKYLSDAYRAGLVEPKEGAPDPNLALERQTRNQPENPRSKAKPADEQAMDEITKRTADQGRVSDDEHLQKGREEITKPSGVHNTRRETDGLNALLKKMGIKEKVRVESLPKGETKGGDYTTATGRIRINDDLHGAERLEVIAHELGHHIVRSELAKAMGIDIKELAGRDRGEIQALLEKHLPPEISADFKKWMAGQDRPENSAQAAIVSRKGFNRAMGIFDRAASSGIKVGELTADSHAYLFRFEEYIADHVSRALTQTDSTPVGKFFKGIADKLKLAYDSLFRGEGGKTFEAAPSVEKWVQSLFDRTTHDVSSALDIPVTREQARTGVEAGLHAAAETHLPTEPPGTPPRAPGAGAPPPSPSPKGLKAMVKFIRYRLPNSARQVLDQALSRGKAIRALNEIYKDQPGALKAMRDPEHGLEARIAYAYLARERGLFQSGPRATSALKNLGDDLLAMANLAGTGTFAERIFNDIANGRIENLRAAGKDYDVKAREAAYRGKAQAIANDATAAYDKVVQPLRKVFTASIDRMRQTGVPAIRRIGAMLQRHSGEAGEDPGMLPAITHTTDRYMRAAGKVFGDLNDRELLHAITALQRQETTHQNPKVQAAIGRAGALFTELAKYGREAGIDIPPREKYFPVVMDLSDEGKVKAFRDLVSQPKFEARIREVLGNGDKPSTKPMPELIDRLTRAAQGLGDPDSEATQTPGGFRAKNYRLLDFLYKQGSPEDIKTFASLQSKSPADIFSRYVQPLVREAEFTRRFGTDGVKLTEAFAEAKKQGATDAQIEQARNAVDGARGQVGLNGSPVLKKLLGDDLANRIANPSTKKGIAYAQTYQNARLLPLAVLSSLVDPMGIAVRTGGDFKTAWTGFKAGMKSLVNKQTRAEMQDMLQRLGSADDFLASDILNSNFGSKDEGGARHINDFIFKANGLAQWTKATRFMALISAHGFLQKHSAGTSATSKRYLDELGLRPGDVRSDGKNVKVLTDAERIGASPSERARDDRVRNALLRFVDESVLRPTSQQAPNWFADPYVGLVTQYKHFAYAIQDQIGKRIAHEIKNGNMKALVPAMSYVPIIIASELLRGGIQYGAGGNPNRKDWGPEDYATYALDRSGLLGPKLAFQSDAVNDAKHGNLPGTSFLGPTAQQGLDVARGRGSIESALPAEALYRHWNDGAQNEQRSTARSN